VGGVTTLAEVGSIGHRLRRVVPYVALVLAKLWLVGGQRLTAYGSLTIDDQWFVARAAAIRDAEWLGEFDTYTLIKQPGYPLFVAAADAVGAPLLLAHQLLYAGAVAIAVAVLAAVLTGRRRLLAFGLLLFDPVTMNTSVSARVDRSLVYGALVVLLVACLVALVDAAARPGRRTLAWSLASAAVLVAVWSCREEFLLVVPAAVVAVLAALVALVRSGVAWGHRVVAVLGLAVIPAAVFAADVALRETNEARYGLAVTNVEQSSVPAALGPMFRVRPVTTFDRYPVTAETRQVLYAASPHLASLRAEIEGGGAQRFVTARPDGVDDLSGAVFQWVLLDAIDATGQAPTATALDDTLRTIGREIDAACGDGRLRCGPRHVGIAPPFDWDRVPELAKRTVYAGWRTVIVAPFEASSPAGDATGNDRAAFERITNEPLATGDDGTLTQARTLVIEVIRWLYLAATAAAIAAAAARLVLVVRRRHRPHMLTVSTVALGGTLVVARLAGLGYLDLTAFPALSPSYLAPTHTVLAVVIVTFVLAVPRPAALPAAVRLAGDERDDSAHAAVVK
jgi:hypothetical protein